MLGELELGWRLVPNETIAVTGSNGKTTTVELIGHLHRTADLPAVVVGNVGTALTSLVGSGLPEATVVVCEASSFQLEDTLRFAPDAGVLLNLAEDHLDRHGTFDAYKAAKLEVFARQPAGTVAVANELLAADVGGRGRAGAVRPRRGRPAAGRGRARCGGTASASSPTTRSACAAPTTARTRWPPPR